MMRAQFATALLLLCGALPAMRARELEPALLVDDECAAGSDCGVEMLQQKASKQPDGKAASIPDLAADAAAAAARAAAEAVLLQRQQEAGASGGKQGTTDGT